MRLSTAENPCTGINAGDTIAAYSSLSLSLCGQKNCLGSHHLEPVPSGLYGTCPSVSSHSCYITTDLYHALHFIYSHTS